MAPDRRGATSVIPGACCSTLPCNHASHQLPCFQEALHDPRQAAYRSWFSFNDLADWLPLLFQRLRPCPEINPRQPGKTRDWMVDIGRYWLREFDADGYPALDYANGPGPDFWSYFYAGLQKLKKADSFLLRRKSSMRPNFSAATSGRLDGCLDFYLEEQLSLHFSAGKTQSVEAFERKRRAPDQPRPIFSGGVRAADLQSTTTI